MPRCVLLSILLLLIFPVDSFAQKTRAEFQAFCQRNRNTETSGEESLYPAQFPTAWRCMNGSVYICEMGASGRGCLKAGFNFSPGEGEQAWCRENPNSDFSSEPLGGKNKVVEIDETYFGGKAANRKNHIPPKTPVLSLVERDGKVRSQRVPNVNGKTLRKVIVTHVDRASYIMTDEAAVYTAIGREFSGHGTVNHSAEEYVRAFFWHTNTVENYFSILKRGIIGVYHHTSQEHLHRYLAEFDFRYNNREGNGVSDSERMAKSVQGIVGRRLTYRRTGSRANV